MKRSKSNKKSKKVKVTSPELEAFRKYSSEFHVALNDGVLTRLAWDLHSADILSQAAVSNITHEMLSESAKATKLVGTLVKSIRTEGCNLPTILKSCEKYLELVPVVKRIYIEYDRLCEVLPDMKLEVNAGAKEDMKHSYSLAWLSKWKYSFIVLLLLIITGAIAFILQSRLHLVDGKFDPSNSLTGDQKSRLPEDSSRHYSGISFRNHEFVNASFPLPSPPKPFVGRMKLVKKIKDSLLNHDISIVGLFGPPAFGKSSLAIHVGHSLQTRFRVNHIDFSEFKLSFEHQNFSALPVSKQVRVYDDGFSRSLDTTRNVNSRFLLSWASALSDVSILVMDNCDQVLQKRHDDFQEFILDMRRSSGDKLKLIITSQRKISFANEFTSFEVSELDQEESKQLIRKLQPVLTDHIQTKIAELVGNCPLAIKVAVMLLKNISPRKLVKELQHNNLHALSSSKFPKRQRFKFVMQVACRHLDNNSKQAAYLLSLFPGSFGEDILSSGVFETFKFEFTNLLGRSLLERYDHQHTERYKLHKLIKTYFNKNLDGIHTALQDMFIEDFQAYYTEAYYNFLTTSVALEFSLDDNLYLTTEQHNLAHLTKLMIKSTSESEYMSAQQIIVLLFAFNQGVTTDNIFDHIFSVAFRLLEVDTIFNSVCSNGTDNITKWCSVLLADVLGSASAKIEVSGHLFCKLWDRIHDPSNLSMPLGSDTKYFLENSYILCSQAFIARILTTLSIVSAAAFLSLHWYRYFAVIMNTLGYTRKKRLYIVLLVVFVVILFYYRDSRVILCLTVLLTIIVLFLGRCMHAALILFWCVFYYFFQLLIITYNIASAFSIQGNASGFFQQWCYLCIGTTTTSWLLHLFRHSFCSFLCPGVPIIVVTYFCYKLTSLILLGSYFVYYGL